MPRQPTRELRHLTLPRAFGAVDQPHRQPSPEGTRRYQHQVASVATDGLGFGKSDTRSSAGRRTWLPNRFAHLKSRDYLVVVDQAEQVRALSPDFPAPGRLTLRPMTESSRRVMLSCTCLTPLLRSGGILFAQAVLAIRSGAENLRRRSRDPSLYTSAKGRDSSVQNLARCASGSIDGAECGGSKAPSVRPRSPTPPLKSSCDRATKPELLQRRCRPRGTPDRPRGVDTAPSKGSRNSYRNF